VNWGLKRALSWDFLNLFAAMQAPTLAIRQFEITQNTQSAAASQVRVCSPDEPARHALTVATSAWQITVTLYRTDEAAVLAAAAAAGRKLSMAVGDISEVAASPAAAHFTNATIVTVDFQNAMITVTTSVTGLPPVFIFRGGTGTSVSSPFIPEAARGLLDPDPAGIADFLRWGHPIDGRTLFSQVSVVLSNSRLELAAGRAAREVPGSAWPTDQFAGLGRAEIIRREVDAFSAAAGRLDHRNAFVSLSGGLDSRTSLVGLLSHGHLVPCVTMAGSGSNLDLRLAQAYCRARGLSHTAVFLDERFDKQVAQLVMESADLTGGVACLSQTVDLYLYNSIGTQPSARVSGNLGNQVGRGGVESLSVYQPVGEVFSLEIRQQLAERPLTPWFIERLAGCGFAEALFGQEVHFWSIPNYIVGSSRAVQLSPYADLELFSLARAGFALDSELGQPTRAVLRARDVRHRMSGIPTEASFQRQFLAERDQRGGRVPLNWGWRARGRPSVRGRLAAAASAADAAMTKLAGKPGRLRPVARWVSAALGHRSSLVDWRRVLHTQLRDLCMDAIRSHPVRQAAVFDQTRLEGLMRDYFDGGDSSQVTVLRALELSLGIIARTGARS
jgi:hypothetical protein